MTNIVTLALRWLPKGNHCEYSKLQRGKKKTTQRKKAFRSKVCKRKWRYWTFDFLPQSCFQIKRNPHKLQTHAWIRSLPRSTGLCLHADLPQAGVYAKQRNALYFQTCNILYFLFMVVYELPYLFLLLFGSFIVSDTAVNPEMIHLITWMSDNPWQRLTNASCSPHLRIGLCRIKSLALPWAPQLCTELGTLQSQRWIHPSEMCLQTNFSQQTKDFWDLKLQCSVWTMANLFITFKLYRR